MKKILYIRIDSSPFTEEGEEITYLDCNLESYFCNFLGRTLLEAIGIDKYVQYPGKLFMDFAEFNKEDYRRIIEQWETTIPYLLNNMYGDIDCLAIKLPSSYCNWLNQHENGCFQEIGRNLSVHPSILCDMESLYNEIIRV